MTDKNKIVNGVLIKKSNNKEKYYAKSKINA